MSPHHQPDRSDDVSQATPNREQIAAGREGGDYEAGESVGDEVRQTLSALMPWGVSILAHAVLVVLAFFLVWQTIIPAPDEPRPTPQLLNPAPQVTMLPDSADVDDQPADVSAAITPVTDTVTPPEPTMPGFTRPVVVIPNPAEHLDGLDKRRHEQGGVGDGIFVDPGPPGKPGGASRIVFIIDASGSMVDVLPFVIDELKRNIRTQDASRQATILIFSGEGVFEVPGGGGVRGLRPLTAAFKQQISEWATLANHRYQTGGPGSAHVLTALDRGLSYKPEVVFLLSDNLTGGGQGATQHEVFQSEVMRVVAKHNNKTGSARINTIQFLYEDPLVRAGLTGTLRLIADETGGSYRFFGQQDLGLR